MDEKIETIVKAYEELLGHSRNWKWEVRYDFNEAVDMGVKFLKYDTLDDETMFTIAVLVMVNLFK